MAGTAMNTTASLNSVLCLGLVPGLHGSGGEHDEDQISKKEQSCCDKISDPPLTATILIEKYINYLYNKTTVIKLYRWARNKGNKSA